MGIELTEVSCKRLNNTKSQSQSTKRSIKHKQVFIYHWKYGNTTKEGLSVDDEENISQKQNIWKLAAISLFNLLVKDAGSIDNSNWWDRGVKDKRERPPTKSNLA